MQRNRLRETIAWMDRVEAPLCHWVNQSLDVEGVSRFFGRISRLGDGIFWYVMMGVLPVLYGTKGVKVTLQMVVVGVIGLVIYRQIKASTSRNRPFMSHQGIRKVILPLDQFSFPSGHTLHAVSFAWLMYNLDPMLGWVSIPFASLVAMSRVILGLHYPSDVLVGATVGLVLAELALASIPV